MIRLLLILAIALFAAGAVVPVMRPMDRDSVGDVQSGYLVNINTVESPTLTLLPGVGPALAQRIVDHRQQIGDFESIDELKDVRGIGEVITERLRPFATVGQGGVLRNE